MELVYLWVEEYKNIHKQGFNFSGRYRCEYDDVKNELTINENKEYLHIFPDNINVTAIVGKNGSGKSSIFEYLYRIIKFSHEILQKQKAKKPLGHDWIRWQDAFNCILVVSIKGELYAIGRIVEKEKQIAFSGLRINNLMSFYDTNKYDTEGVLDTKNLNNFANFIGNEIELNSSVLWVDYSFGVPYIPYDSYRGYEEDYFEHIVNQRFFIEPNKIYNRDKAVNIRVEEEKNTKRILNYFFNQKDGSPSVVDFFKPNILELRINFERLGLSSAKGVASKTIGELNGHYIKLYRDNNDYVIEVEKAKQFQNNIELLNGLLDLKTKYEINHDLPIDININKLKSAKHLDLLLEALSHAPRYLMLDLIRHEKGMRNVQRFSTLSSGEKGLLKIIGNLDYLIKKTSSGSIILLLDEIEMYLHPEWQRKFLYYIIPILEAHKPKQFFCFIATHSPFVISDLQKDNIVFLNNGKQKDGVSHNSTFGANIHTLLSDAFFMEDGLVGEYAKGKINKAIELLNKKGRLSKATLEYCEGIVSIIGEPILKRQMRRMLDSKRLLKIDEIDLIKAEVSELQKKLKGKK
jgi:AAA15 family ATPase/GTPase